jgi:hypothetical protein
MTTEYRNEIMLEDGRRAERVVRENVDCDTKTGKRITEVWADPKPPKRHLHQRIVEELAPVVKHRELESYDEETGEMLSKDVEALESEHDLKVVDRLVSSYAVAQEEVSSQNYDDCVVTRSEMREDICEAMKMVVKAVKNGNGNGHVVGYSADSGHRSQRKQVSAMQAVLEDRLEEKKSGGMSGVNILLLALISALVAGLAWILFV